MTTAADARRPAPTQREVPRLRPCLAPDHQHLIWCTKGNRMCERGRNTVSAIDPLYGSVSGMSLKTRETYRPYAGLAAYAMETT